MKTIKWTWECTECEGVVESFSNKRHDMNFCKCGKSGVDLEGGYARSSGSVEIIKIEEIKK